MASLNPYPLQYSVSFQEGGADPGFRVHSFESESYEPLRLRGLKRWQADAIVAILSADPPKVEAY